MLLHHAPFSVARQVRLSVVSAQEHGAKALIQGFGTVLFAYVEQHAFIYALRALA